MDGPFGIVIEKGDKLPGSRHETIKCKLHENSWDIDAKCALKDLVYIMGLLAINGIVAVKREHMSTSPNMPAIIEACKAHGWSLIGKDGFPWHIMSPDADNVFCIRPEKGRVYVWRDFYDTWNVKADCSFIDCLDVLHVLGHNGVEV